MSRGFVLITLCFIAISCDSRSNVENGDGMSRDMISFTPYRAMDMDTIGVDHQMMIRTAHLEIKVDDLEKVRQSVTKICQNLNTYVSFESHENLPDRLQIEQTLRIPASHFDSLVHSLERLGTTVDSKQIQSTDVTTDFIDTEARMKTKRKLEQRYHEILQKATKVSDMLSIESQLNQVRADIESMEGRLTYWRNQTAFSTLKFVYYQPIESESGFGSEIGSSIASGWHSLLAFVNALLRMWPFLLIVMALSLVIIRKVRPLISSKLRFVSKDAHPNP